MKMQARSPDFMIHVVDDDVAVRDSLSLLLGLTYPRVVAFSSGVEFLDQVSDDPPDCLILDIHMPGKTGLEVMRDLAAMGIRLPTILTTGRVDSVLRSQAAEEGAVAILDKPLDHSMLIEAIEQGARASLVACTQ
jgi:two-component system, LuxR family, response regulator FixJ